MQTTPTQIIRVTLITLLVSTPWLFGGVWARVQWIVLLIAAILLAIDLIGRFGEDDRPNLAPVAWLPLLLGIAIGVFQLVPMTAATASRLAPETLRLRQQLTIDRAGGDTDATLNESEVGEGLGKFPRSLYPVATREQVALLVLATAVLVLVSSHMVDKQSILWLSVATAICGAALSFFGLIQRLSWNGKFYWFVETAAGTSASFGPFVNRNNAGVFLNICLAAGLALLIWVHWNKPAEPGEEEPRAKRRRRRRKSSSRRSRSSDFPGTEPTDVDRESAELSEILEAANRPIQDATTADGPEVESPPSSGTLADQFKEAKAQEASRRAASKADSPMRENDQRSGHRTSKSRRGRGSSGQRSRSRERSGRTAGEKRQRYSHAAYPLSYDQSGTSAKTADSRFDFVSTYVADLSARRVWSLVLIGVIAGGVLCTASRGSILAMIAATLFTAAALAFQAGNRAYALGLLLALLAGGGLMSWAGQTDFVKQRFEQMLDESSYEVGRLPNWRDSMQNVPEFWTLGTGLGTYRYVCERFQHRYLGDRIHFHAENQFVQALVEGGVIALGLLLVQIALTAIAIGYLFSIGGRTNTALAVAGTFGLASQVFGGFFDFGLYITSNTMLMAALCGIVIGRAALLTVWPTHLLDADNSTRGYDFTATRDENAGRALLPSGDSIIQGSTKSKRAVKARMSQPQLYRSAVISMPASPTFVTTVVGFLLLGCLFGSLELNKAAKIEAAISGPVSINRLENPTEIMSLLGRLTTALPQRWDDANAHRRLAELYIQHYVAQTYQRLLDETPDDAMATTSGQDESPRRDLELWSRASIWHLHNTVCQLKQQGKDQQLRELLNQPHVTESLVPALRHVLRARHAAPTLPYVHLMLAELSPLFDSAGDEIVHLDRAERLAPGDAELLYWVGLLHMNAGRIELSSRAWQRSLDLSTVHLHDIVRGAQGRLTARQLLNDVLPRRADVILNVTRAYFGSPERAAIRAAFLSRAEEMLEDADFPPDQMAYTQASIDRLQEEYETALKNYARAILHNSKNDVWRYEYATLLLQQRQYEEARKLASYLVRKHRKSMAYRQLLEEATAKQVRSDAERIREESGRN